ncbi:MAG: phage repressor protein [Campylobacterales bacterium]|nr:phage repressor protein [Campylobacterales bacterium]
MRNINEIIEKIKDIIAKNLGGKRVFDKDVASALKITPNTFATMKSRGKIPYEEVIGFCVKNRISVNWLLYEQDTSSLVETTNQYAYVKYFQNVSASAGGGADVDDEENGKLFIDDQVANRLGMSLNSIEAINVVGESMEPTLKDGDILFIDRDKTDISRGGVFVVSSPHGVFVKRVFKRVDGQIDIISDNQDYSPQTLTPDEVTIVGKAVGVFGSVD